MQNLNYKTKIEILSTIDELKQIVRSNGFQESQGISLVGIEIEVLQNLLPFSCINTKRHQKAETVIDLLDELINKLKTNGEIN